MTHSATAHMKSFVLSHHVGVLATHFEGRPEAATIFYVSSDGFRLFYKSRTGSRHAKSLAIVPTVALCIYEHASNYVDKWGVQLIGRSGRVREEAEMRTVVDLYGRKFGPAASKKLDLVELLADDSSSTFFWFDIVEFKSVSTVADQHVETYVRLEQ